MHLAGNLRWLLANLQYASNRNREPRVTLRGERVAITAKQMAHRDIPVVFHHINFTPVPTVFQKCDKMETARGREKSRRKKRRAKEEKNNELGDT